MQCTTALWAFQFVHSACPVHLSFGVVISDSKNCSQVPCSASGLLVLSPGNVSCFVVCPQYMSRVRQGCWAPVLTGGSSHCPSQLRHQPPALGAATQGSAQGNGHNGFFTWKKRGTRWSENDEAEAGGESTHDCKGAACGSWCWTTTVALTIPLCEAGLLHVMDIGAVQSNHMTSTFTWKNLEQSREVHGLRGAK